MPSESNEKEVDKMFKRLGLLTGMMLSVFVLFGNTANAQVANGSPLYDPAMGLQYYLNFMKPEIYNSFDSATKDVVISFVSTAIADDLGLSYVPKVQFKSRDEMTRLRGFEVSGYADSNGGITLANDLTAGFGDYSILRTLAHELRHFYQFKHMRDYTEYARRLDGVASSYGDEYSFVEQDAEGYAQLLTGDTRYGAYKAYFDNADGTKTAYYVYNVDAQYGSEAESSAEPMEIEYHDDGRIEMSDGLIVLPK